MSRPSNTLAPPLLDVEAIEARYGKNDVVRCVSLQVSAGEVVSLIGPNAAGKTTTLRSIMGLKSLRGGRVRFDGADVTRSSTATRVRRGLVLVPEGRQLFPDFSVRENLEMGAFSRKDRNALGDDIDRAFALFPRLAERQHQRAGSMSGGEQQMVAIARGLMAKPRCLLLDEPTLGLAPVIITEIERALHRLATEGLTILISEQNALVALNISSRAYVIESGKIRAQGASREFRDSPDMQSHYWGNRKQPAPPANQRQGLLPAFGR